MSSNELDLGLAMGLSTARLLLRTREGRHPSVDTLRRWADPTQGCKPAGRNGPTIYLRVQAHEGVLLTCREWVEEFDRLRQELGAKQTNDVLT